MSISLKFTLTVALIFLTTALGYVSRRRQWVPERAAEYLMTAVIVCGYSIVGLLSVWTTRLSGLDIWLPVLGAVHVVLATGAGMVSGRLVSRQRDQAGMFAVLTSMGNNGFTMGGFICYILFGEAGLAKTSLLGIMWPVVVSGLVYPVARHYATEGPAKPLARLVRESLLDYRSIGLPMLIVGVLLSMGGVPRPAWISDWSIVDILMWLTGATAYFSIGLRLRFAHVWPLRKLIAALAGTRFVVGLALGLLLAAVTLLTPWPMDGLNARIFVIESFVPTAITAVAVANMFRLRPQEASMLFTVNTAMYLVIVLPVMLAVLRWLG